LLNRLARRLGLSTGTPIEPRNVARRWVKPQERAGLRGLGFRVLAVDSPMRR